MRERIRRKRCAVLETLPNAARIACAVYDKCKGGALVKAAVKCKDYPARLIRADGHCYIRKNKVNCATQATSDELCHVPGRPNNFGDRTLLNLLQESIYNSRTR
uniref:Uncharacterized protein n=1 Tax=Romanomermis culicivorax TaxID=13658 RepID=A0A915HKU9_ROMCU